MYVFIDLEPGRKEGDDGHGDTEIFSKPLAQKENSK